jgi:hypothetical protein
MPAAALLPVPCQPCALRMQHAIMPSAPVAHCSRGEKLMLARSLALSLAPSTIDSRSAGVSGCCVSVSALWLCCWIGQYYYMYRPYGLNYTIDLYCGLKFRHVRDS